MRRFTVLINGVAARSCVIPIEGCTGRDIVTLEGLGTREHPDPVQQAFIREQAAQCGYCLNGMIIATKALLLRSLTRPRPKCWKRCAIICAGVARISKSCARQCALPAARRGAGVMTADAEQDRNRLQGRRCRC